MEKQKTKGKQQQKKKFKTSLDVLEEFAEHGIDVRIANKLGIKLISKISEYADDMYASKIIVYLYNMLKDFDNVKLMYSLGNKLVVSADDYTLTFTILHDTIMFDNFIKGAK